MLRRAVCLAILLVGVSAAPASAQGTCEKRVAFGLVEATTAGCLTQSQPGRWESTDTVTVNGLALPVAAGTRLVLSGPSDDAPGGRLSVETEITLEGITVHQGKLEFELPQGGQGDEADAESFRPAQDQQLFGLSVGGSAALRLGYGADGQHYSLFRIVLDLPDLFRNGPGQDAGGLTATVGVRVDDRGVRADAVKAEVRNAYIGQIAIKDLCLSYTAAGSTTTDPCSPPAFGAQPLISCEAGTDVSRWDGAAVITLPTESSTEVGVFAGVSGDQFSYAGAQVTNLGEAVPLATGVYLDRVGLAICIQPPPMKFTGAAAIRFGPDFGGQKALLLDGQVEYVDSRPWVISAKGGVSVFGYQVADGYFTYKSSGSIDFGFHAGFDFGIASVSAGVDGWIETQEPVRFNVDGYGSVCVVVVACIRGEITVSTVGIAGCLTLLEGDIWELHEDADFVWYAPWRVHWELRHWRLRAGLGYRWGGSVDVMGDSCDVGPYRAVRSAAAAAQQAAPQYHAARRDDGRPPGRGQDGSAQARDQGTGRPAHRLAVGGRPDRERPLRDRRGARGAGDPRGHRSPAGRQVDNRDAARLVRDRRCATGRGRRASHSAGRRRRPRLHARPRLLVPRRGSRDHLRRAQRRPQ